MHGTIRSRRVTGDIRDGLPYAFLVNIKERSFPGKVEKMENGPLEQREGIARTRSGRASQGLTDVLTLVEDIIAGTSIVDE